LVFRRGQRVSLQEGRLFVRIPSNKIQWEWNRSTTNTVVIETHAPQMIGGQSLEGAVGLFDESETPAVTGPAGNVFVAYDTESVEKKYNLY
jgi:hypothetical protein